MIVAIIVGFLCCCLAIVVLLPLVCYTSVLCVVKSYSFCAVVNRVADLFFTVECDAVIPS